MDGLADASGAFECNTREGEYNTKFIDLPEDFSCDKCTLQLVWMTESNATFYSCADFTVINDMVKKCVGKCQNGGICSNGVCDCVEPFTGEFCQNEGIFLDYNRCCGY